MSSAGSWRAPAGLPPQIKPVSDAITTGKRHAAEMLGEYLVPPIIDFSVRSRGSVDNIVLPEHADDYSAVESRRLRGKSSRLCGVSNEDNGVTSTENKAFRRCEAADEGQTSIKDEAFRTCEASDDKVFRSREASDEDHGSTSAADHAAFNKSFRSCEASD